LLTIRGGGTPPLRRADAVVSRQATPAGGVFIVVVKPWTMQRDHVNSILETSFGPIP
jgi:hypothetical protein